MAGRVSSSLATVVVVLALAVGGGVLLLQGHKDGGQKSDRPTHARSAERKQSGVQYAALPQEARGTVDRILAGGPFLYSQDGTVFVNREGLLPDRPYGYYHEYTVPTPGASDRGARRIVSGKGTEMYYTADHYRSFRPIIGVPGGKTGAGQ